MHAGVLCIATQWVMYFNVRVNSSAPCLAFVLSVSHEMLVAWCLLFLIHVGLALAKPPVRVYNVSQLKCSSLCSLPFERASGRTIRISEGTTVNLDGKCVRKFEFSIGNWEKSARHFLQLIYMSDSWFECPKWNAVYRKPNKTELLTFWTQRNGKRSRMKPYFETSVVEPAGIPGHCNITVDRGVVEQNSHHYLMDAELQYGGNPLITTGSTISLWKEHPLGLEFGIHPFPVHIQQNESNRCRGKSCPAYETMWLPASTFGTSVPYKKGTTEHYSIYAKWKFQ